jgi:endo-1,4-beta-xylanase
MTTKKPSLLTRRHLFYLMLAAGGLPAFAQGNNNYPNYDLQINHDPSKKSSVPWDAPLKDHAIVNGILYGGGSVHGILTQDANLGNVLKTQCNMLVPERELKWDILRPSPDTYDFYRGDWMINYAQSNGMSVRGHTLVWYQSNPYWFKDVVNQQNAEKFLVEHIRTVMQHYKGKIHSWDVVNEAVDPAYGRPDGLHYSPWLELLGPGYIDLAYRVAKEVDPQTILYYNEAALEYDTPEHEARRNATLKFLERLKSSGVPIQGFGIQGHLIAHEIRFNPQKFRKFLSDVASLGLEIMITELDVSDQALPYELAIRDRIIANVYEQFLSVVLDEPAVKAIVHWGISDRYTWLTDYRPRPDRQPVRPLPMDVNLDRKWAWDAIVRALDHAPKR